MSTLVRIVVTLTLSILILRTYPYNGIDVVQKYNKINR
jgi:hypothetical protein